MNLVIFVALIGIASSSYGMENSTLTLEQFDALRANCKSGVLEIDEEHNAIIVPYNKKNTSIPFAGIHAVTKVIPELFSACTQCSGLEKGIKISMPEATLAPAKKMLLAHLRWKRLNEAQLRSYETLAEEDSLAYGAWLTFNEEETKYKELFPQKPSDLFYSEYKPNITIERYNPGSNTISSCETILSREEAQNELAIIKQNRDRFIDALMGSTIHDLTRMAQENAPLDFTGILVRRHISEATIYSPETHAFTLYYPHGLSLKMATSSEK